MAAVMERASRTADDATTQVRRLRGEVEALMRDTVTPALQDAFERAAGATRQARAHSETLAGGVRGRPLISIAIAATVGFLFGRVTR